MLRELLRFSRVASAEAFRRFRPRSRPFERILVTRIQNVGDCVVMLPTLAQIRRSFPEARIDVLAGTSAGEAIFGMCPAVDSVLRTRWPGPLSRSEIWREIEMIRSGNYDAILLSTQETGMALKAFLAGVPMRAGFDRIIHMSGVHTERFPLLLTDVLRQPEGEHEALVNLQLVSTLGAEVGEPRFCLKPPDAAFESASNLFHETGVDPASCVVVHAGTKQAIKRWPADAFAAVCDACAEAGMNVVLIGAPGEEETVQEVSSRMRQKSVNLCGRTSLPDLAAILMQCRAFLGNDSGPMHLAAACGAAVCAIFVASDAQTWGPWTALERRRVFSGPDTSPAEVTSAMLELLEQGSGAKPAREAC